MNAVLPDWLNPVTASRSRRPRAIEGGARPVGVALMQQRQVEEPLARIVEDLEPQLGGAAKSAADCAAEPEHAPRRKPQR